MKRFLRLLCLAVPLATGCTSYARTQKASTQIAFGERVAEIGYWREALFRFEEAIALDPGNPHAHNNLAVAYEATGEFAKALAEYKKALELAPGNAAIQRNYARFAEFYTAYTRTVGKAVSGP